MDTCVPGSCSAHEWRCSVAVEIGVDDPRGADRKKLIVWVEIDRCMTDAISAVTGVRLGNAKFEVR